MISWFSKKPEPEKEKAVEPRTPPSTDGPRQPPMPRSKHAKSKPVSPRPASQERTANITKIQKIVQDTATPEREALIKQALRIRRTQTKVLDDLNDEDKLKLYAVAVRAMMGKEPDGGGRR